MFLKFLELTGTILSIHPLFYILKNRKYSADPNLLTFYLIKDWISKSFNDIEEKKGKNIRNLRSYIH